MPIINNDLVINYPPWAEGVIEPTARYRGLYGGRGGGKSHLFADLIIDICVKEKKNIVCIREVQNTLAQSAKRLIEDKIKLHGVGHLFEVQQSQIKCKNGGVIIFNGMQDHNAESIKSLEGFDIAWIEEAQSLSQRSLDLLRPTIRKEYSEIWASWNPRFETDPIDQLLRNNPPPGSIVRKVGFRDNPWFPTVLISEMQYDKDRDLEKYMHVWEGDYLRNSEARVFKNWKVEEFEHRDDVVRRQGADWGFSVDPTVLINCYVEGKTLFVEYEAYKVGCEIDDIPSLFEENVPESKKWPIVADSQRPDTISYVRNHGYPKIVPAVKGPGSIEDGIEHLQNYNIIVHPRCKHTIDELTHYSYKVDVHTDQILPILVDKNNHVIDSLRYANEGYRRIENMQTIKIENVFRWDNDSIKDMIINVYMMVLTPNEKRNTDKTTITVMGLAGDGSSYLLDGITDVMDLEKRSETMMRFHRKWRPITTGYDLEGYELDKDYHEAIMEQLNYRYPSIPVKIEKDFTNHVKLFIPVIDSGKYYTPVIVKFKDNNGKMQDLVKIHDTELENYPLSVNIEILLGVSMLRNAEFGAIFPELDEEIPFGREVTMAKTEYSLFGE